MTKKNNGSPPTEICSKCGGKGRVEISDDLVGVLRFVRRHPGCTVADVHRALDSGDLFQPTAFNNRLEGLRKLNLVTRVRAGRNWMYRTL